MTAARGLRAAGVSAGITRSRKPDLALVVADEPATAAAVFTRNRVQAAPVQVSRARLRGGWARAVLINSGCANCLTGAVGERDVHQISSALGRALGVRTSDILVASTGLIGTRLPLARVLRAVPTLVRHLDRANHAAAAQAILTTDLRLKEAAVEARVGGRRCRVGGMAKGAGMIAPSMATTLCVVTTDASVTPGLLRRLLREAAAETFNRITVDGDMSTNDTVFALATGRSGAVVRPGSRELAVVRSMLVAVMGRLAEAIVRDGEGAMRVMRLEVMGARTPAEAQACARQVAESPLVKTMLAGGDPNVGRIAAAVGASPARFNPRRLHIDVGGRRLVRGGVAAAVPAAVARRLLSRRTVNVRVDLQAGSARSWMLACDLTEEYVRINAGYAS